MGKAWVGVLLGSCLLTVPPGQAVAQGVGPDSGPAESVARSGEDGGEAGSGEDAGQAEGPSTANSGQAALPDPFGPFFRAIDPAQLQRRLDEVWGLDAGEQSDKPEAPEIPLAVFVEVIRPLGGLKYEGQANYFLGAFTGRAPTLQVLTYEYVFADWNAARVELTYPDGNLEALVAGYQRTLGVGPRGNWVHGFQVLTDIFLQDDFVGGTAFYVLGWKPEKESPWSVGFALGANRTALEEAEGTGSQPGARAARRTPGDAEPGRLAGVWRPYVSLNLFYTLGQSLAVGLENDLYPSDRLGEYLVLPNFTWRPAQHFFLQAGAGYYQLGSDVQAAFAVRANVLFPSPRKPRPVEGGGQDRGCLRRWLGRG